MSLFSVVVPVYQAQKYLSRCIKGVLQQSVTDWEILLVDDGSTDGSGELCDLYSMTDNRIKTFHKENGGAASARNLGLEKAVGKYILFLDSDDYWEESSFLMHLAEKMNDGYDICLFGCIDEYADTGERIVSRGKYDEILFKYGEKGEILCALMEKNQFPGACWIFCSRRSFLLQRSIWFIEGNRTEDIDWILQVLSKADKMGCLDEPCYIYTKNRMDSITRTAGLQSIKSILSIVIKWMPRLSELNESSYTALNSYLTFEFLTAIILYDRLNDHEKKTARSMFRGVKLDSRHLIGKKIIVGSLIYRFLGLECASKLLKLGHRV